MTEGPHTLTGCVQPLPAATATATGLLTKVGSDLDAACGAVGAAVPSDVRGEYTQSAPLFVRFHSPGALRVSGSVTEIKFTCFPDIPGTTYVFMACVLAQLTHITRLMG